MNSPLNRPGITSEFLKKAGITCVDEETAFRLCGIRESGLWIPHHDIHGQPILQDGKPFGRLRLQSPTTKKKYHQEFGTKLEAYIPPDFRSIQAGVDLIVIEGEYKSMSLLEAGYAAVGIPGFYGFAEKGGKKLLDGITQAIRTKRPRRLFFGGDSDTWFNHQFAQAAVRFTNLVAPKPVFLLLVPLDAPGKGVDDCKEVLRDRFSTWFGNLLSNPVEITSKMKPEELCLDLLHRSARNLEQLSQFERRRISKKIVRIGVFLHNKPLLLEELLMFAEKHLKLKRIALKKEIENEILQLRRGQKTQNGSKECETKGKEVDLKQQAGVWTREVFEVIKSNIFVYNDNVCRLSDDRLLPFSPSEIISYVDHPDRCRFGKPNKDGEFVRKPFYENHARILLGAWRENKGHLREVQVVSKVPVLAWDGEKAILISEYCSKTNILATGTEIDLPPIRKAFGNLCSLLQDFDFSSTEDFQRAISFILTPALIQGGFLGFGRPPLFLVEKDSHGAGASLLIRIVSLIYGIAPRPVTRLDNPQDAMEEISMALFAGDGLIYLDNVRGKGLSKLASFESLLTEDTFIGRVPYLQGEIDVRKRVFAVSSNGAVFSPDLASRTLRIVIKKRPNAYEFYQWAEGSLEDHVAKNLYKYLASVFSLMKPWADGGRPSGTKNTNFRYPRCEKAINGILQPYFDDLPVIDANHQSDQELLSDPDHDFLN